MTPENIEQMANFGTKDYPIRSSNLTALKKCPGWLISDMLYDDNRDPFVATHTGTGFGVAAEIYHDEYEPEPLTAEEIKDIITKVRWQSNEGGGRSESEPFPKCDMGDIEEWLKCYVADPRNHRNSRYGEVIPESLEVAIEFCLEPHPRDRTRKDIYITGHLDQVRRHPGDGVLEVWDIKTSRRFSNVRHMIPYYAAQQCAYAVGLAKVWDEPVRWGGLIHPPSYKSTKLIPNPGTDPKKKGKKIRVPKALHECYVFIRSGYTKHAVEQQVNHLRFLIAMIRAGKVLLNSGEHCDFCPQQNFVNCSEEFEI